MLSFIKHSAIRRKGYLWFLLVTVTLLVGAVTPVLAGPLDNWHWRNPLPQGNALNGVTYGNNSFVAVGENGTIVTSADGTTWTSRTSGTTNLLNGVTYGKNSYVAVGDDGLILTSADALSWTSRTSGTTNTLNGVTYGNNSFVAIGYRGTILTSADGITWTSQTADTCAFYGVTYGNNSFVAVGTDGTNGTILTSTDGINWTKRTTGMTSWLTGVTYGNNSFVAVGDVILTSEDGITWSSRTTGTTHVLLGVTYDKNSFVAVGQGATIVTSTDGINWISRTSGTTNWINGITCGNNSFVAVGFNNNGNGSILTSADGISWISRTEGTTDWINGITYGNNSFVAVGFNNNGNGSIITSADGINWTSLSEITANLLNGVTHGNNSFVAVGNFGTIFTSEDGINWTIRTTDTIKGINGITYGNSCFVAVGDGGIILTSADGISWTDRISGTTNILNGVTYGKNSYVAVGSNGTILTSTDGIDWTTRVAGMTNWLSGVTYANNTFAAVGRDGTIITSTDGINWTSQTAGTINDLKGITYSDTSFVVVGDNGTILTSADGISWTSWTSGTTKSLTGVTYGKNSYVVVGKSGTILQSDMLIPELTITTTGLGQASVGSLYIETISASGGTAPFSWSASGLPTGLSINTFTGVISGTPVTAGTSIVNITVTDSKSQSSSSSLSITVNPSDLAVTGVEFDKSSITIMTGRTEQLTATISPAGATDTSVTWAVNSQSGDNIVTVSSAGLVTGVNAGTAVIRATSNADTTKYAECNVTVQDSVADTDTSSKLAAGSAHSLVIMEDGTLWAWGRNTRGQLGDGTSTQVRLTPVKVMNEVKSVAAGGMGYFDGHTMAIKEDDTLWTWGDNDSGQLGNGNSMVDLATPVQIMGGVKSIAAGYSHSLALKQDGALWAWGNNWCGQLGDGTTSLNAKKNPKQVMSGVTHVAAGLYHTLAIKEDGTLWSWGKNGAGELGDGTTLNRATPVQIMSGVKSVAAGGYHTMAIKEDGTLWAWGDNFNGELGDGTTLNRTTPIQVMSGVQSVAAGDGHTLVIKEDGTLWAWGDNKYGQLGDGTTLNRVTPVQVMSGVKSVSAGHWFTLAVKEDKTLWAWGNNLYGELGDGTNTDRLLPVQVMSIGRTTVSVTGIILDKEYINLTEGQTEQLIATIVPTFATDKSVTWSSSDPTVATVQNGVVCGVKTGTAIITVSSNSDPTETATCTVTVNKPTGLIGIPSDKSVILIWSANPEPDLGGYQLEYKTAEAADWTTVQLTNEVALFRVTTLTNGIEYSFRIKTKDTAGNWSAYSDTVKVIPVSIEDEAAAETSAKLVVEAYEATPFDTNVNLSKARILEQLATDAVAAVKDTNKAVILQSRIDDQTAAITDAQSNTPIVENLDELYLNRPYQDVLMSNMNDPEKYDPLFDFYTALAPANGDIPSITAGRRGYGTKTVFQDINGMGDVEFRFSKKADGKYSFKYKTGIYRYPYDYNMVEEFIPGQNGKIILLVRGDDIKNSQDNVGAKINIYNLTDNCVDIIVLGIREDQKNRLLVNSKVGKVKVYWEASKPPAVPTNFKVSYTNDNQVASTWTAPDDTDLAGFQLEYKKAEDALWTQVPLEKVTSYSLTGLANDTEYRFRLKAKDTDGNWSVYTSEVSTTLAIYINELTFAVVRTPYLVTLVANGGTVPYIWSAAGLPAGLTINTSSGVISGIPTSAGTFTINVSVTDDTGQNSNVSLNLIVKPLSPGDPLNSWSSRVSGTSYPLSSITYGNNNFLAVGQNGTIVSSSDGINWSSQASGTTWDLSDITFRNNIFVVVGKRENIFTSPDGATWTRRNSGSGSLHEDLYGIAYGNNKFVAVGDGRILTSTDGITWTRTIGNVPSCVTYGNNTFVGVGGSGGIVTSSDGINWTGRTSGTSQNLRRVSYCNNSFIVVGDCGTILTSVDGTYWNSQVSGTTQCLLGVTYGNGSYVAVGEGGTLLTSPDSITWTSRASNTTNLLRGVIYDANGIVVVGNNGMILTPSLSINTTTLISGNVGLPYYAALSARGSVSPYTWSATGLPAGLSIDPATGVICGTPTIVGAFTVNITVNDSTAQSISISLSITVNPAIVAVTGISLNKASTTLSIGKSERLIATITPDIATDKSVTWSVSSQSGSYIARVSTTGLVTAVNEGTAVVRASSNADTSMYAECSVTITAEENAVKYIKLAESSVHSLVIKEDGTLWAWGYNGLGELGDGTMTKRATPVQVMSDVKSVVAGDDSVGGYGNTLAIKEDGTLWAWGWNAWGQLGDGTTTDRATPVQVMSGVKSVTAGGDYTMTIKEDGTLWAWGYNGFGQLGDGTTTDRATPVQVMSGVKSVVSGQYHTIAIKEDGTMWTWGNNNYGLLGDGTTINRPTPVQVMNGVKSVVAGYLHNMAIKEDGTLWAWGWNKYGELGDGTRTDRVTPVLVMSDVKSVTVSLIHSLAIKDDGTLWAWGNNGWGQLGDGTTTDRATPVQVMNGVNSVVAINGRTFVIKQEGSLWAWGWNDKGQLGNGTTSDRATPVQVMSCVNSIVAGEYNTLATKQDGTLWAWGSNAGGKLGDGTQIARSAPVLIMRVGLPSVWVGVPVVHVDINPNDSNSSGIFIGLDVIKDSTGNVISNQIIAGYQIEVDYDPTKLALLDVVDEAHLGHFTKEVDSTGKVTVTDSSTNGTASFNKMFFLPITLTGSALDSTSLQVKYLSVSDAAQNQISVENPPALEFLRGKILNEEPGTKLNTNDAVAGLQYLAGLKNAGSDLGQVNPVNMASIIAQNSGTTVIKPSVKDIIALMQYLVQLRDSNFGLVSN